jgi:uncharacterized membrane protein YkvA (DUF1232 family)
MLRALVISTVAVAVAWGAFLVVVFVVRPDGLALHDAMRLLPDTVRLIRRLASDRSVPFGTRVTVWLLMLYLASPIDLIPDFVPVIGYADDAILASFVLRRLIRRAGSEKLSEHWPGSPEGLETLRRVLRLGDTP